MGQGRAKGGRRRIARSIGAGVVAAAAFGLVSAGPARADICEDPSSPTGFVECPTPPPVTAPPITVPVFPESPAPPVTRPDPAPPRPTPTPSVTAPGRVSSPTTAPRTSPARTPGTVATRSAPPVVDAPTPAPAPVTAAVPETATTTPTATAPAAAPPRGAPSSTTTAPVRPAVDDLRLASDARELSSNQSLVPVLLIVGLLGFLFLGGYWAYVTVFGRR